MSQIALADFVGQINAEQAAWDTHQEGRVLLGADQLVLATSQDDRVSIPLSAVFDITLESTPRTFDPVPGMPVTIAYESGGNRVVAVVSSDESTAKKFYTVLFKAVLNGAEMTVKHPSRTLSLLGRYLRRHYDRSPVDDARAGRCQSLYGSI